MQNRTYLIIAAVLMAAALFAVVFAANTKASTVGSASAAGNFQPEPPLKAKGWINTKPLTEADLKGKVVLYDFWTYSCVNCVRTIPYVRSWYDRYKAAGLVVIGVHSPEFTFEKNHANVAKAVKKLGVDYPVALDDDMTIWNEFDNQYWPADYLYNRQGKQAETHFGEGGYTDTENEIRKLLGVPASYPHATVHGSEGGTDGSENQTPETYNGAERGADSFASPQPLTDGPNTFTAPSTLQPDAHALVGKWLISDEYVQSDAPGSVVLLRFQAGTVNLVLDTADGKPADLAVSVDGKALPTVHVTAAELYTLASHQTPGYHTLKLTALRAGLQVYAFTFGG
jgi:thiol-disulfide isomerase/thioredoxin